jgi:aryl-alcohol dehydrogenase-like predicted oxidoreductase
MEHQTLGKSDLRVAVIGMGTWRTFDVSGAAAEAKARTIVDRALAAGVNFFDSSPMYGRAERVLGQTLQGRRDTALVATKGWARSLPEAHAQVNGAFNFFGGQVDLYQLHNLANWRENLALLESLRSPAGSGRLESLITAPVSWAN